MSNIIAITKREISGYFASPIAFVFIVIFLLLSGFFTFMVAGFFENGEATLAPFFVWHPWLYLFLVPAVGMRMWSEERRLGTIELLLTMPITPWQAIFGKFLASWAVIALAVVLTFPLVLTVNYLGHPDNGVIFAGYLGSLLMAGAYLAISALGLWTYLEEYERFSTTRSRAFASDLSNNGVSANVDVLGGASKLVDGTLLGCSGAGLCRQRDCLRAWVPLTL